MTSRLPALAALAAPAAAALLAAPSEAGSATFRDIFRTVRAFEVDAYGLMPDATLELLDLAPGDPKRTRPWRSVPGSGVIRVPQVRRMSVAGVWGDRAAADAVTFARIYRVGPAGFDYDMTHILFDRIELRRIGSRWLVASVRRRVRDVEEQPAPPLR